MNEHHKEKLLEIYDRSLDISDIKNIPEKTLIFLKIITDNLDRNKGVYTVLITLMVHKRRASDNPRRRNRQDL